MKQSSFPVGALDSERVAPGEQACAALRSGRAVIWVDDEDPKNEGDRVSAPEPTTPEAINPMGPRGRDLVCPALPAEQLARLEPRLLPEGGAPLAPDPRVSTEVRNGVTQGTRAAARSKTVQAAIATQAGQAGVVGPAQSFLRQARPGHLLVRSGQREGSFDKARPGDQRPVAGVGEILNDNGSMTRRPDVRRCGRLHAQPIVTIAALIPYRLHTERRVARIAESEVFLDDTQSPWRLVTYAAEVEGGPFLAFFKGKPDSGPERRCRVHRATTQQHNGSPHRRIPHGRKRARQPSSSLSEYRGSWARLRAVHAENSDRGQRDMSLGRSATGCSGAERRASRCPPRDRVGQSDVEGARLGANAVADQRSIQASGHRRLHTARVGQ